MAEAIEGRWLMPGVDIAIGTFLLNAGASFATASAIVTALPTVALAAASVAASTVIAERQRAAFQSALSGINSDKGLQQDTPDASPEQLMLLGTATLSGRRFFLRGGEDLEPYFYIGRILAAHECDGLDSVYINNKRITFDSNGLAVSLPFYDGSTHFVEASFRNGHIDQAIDPIIARDFPGEYPETFRQRGHATIVYKAHFGTGGDYEAKGDKHQALYGDGPFNPIARVRGAKVYDPRDLNQDKNDPATWKWSDNAVLNTLHGLCWKFPTMRPFIDWERVKDEADICDTWVRSKSGLLFRQFTLNGALNSGDDGAQLIDAMLSASGGQLIRNKGKIHVMAAQIKKPIGTLHKGNLRGGLEYFRDKAQGETVNEVRPEFMSPERNFQIVPGPVIRNEDDVEEDGTERPISPRFPFTEYHYRAQRLATRIAKEARVSETLAAGVDISGLNWAAGRVITLDLGFWSPRLTGDWEILKRNLDIETGFYRLSLRRYDPAVNYFDPATEEQEFEVEEIAE